MILYYWSKFIKKIRGKSILNSYVHKTSKIEAGSLFVQSKMDKHSFCGYDCEISNCIIGAYTSIANRVVIGGGMHPMDWVGMSPVFYKGRDSVRAKFSEFNREDSKNTIIGNDVWIGHSCLIKQGVKIGNGAVIGMGSVVTKDIPPYAIYAGNPAKLIRYRFDQEIIDELLSIKWWEMDDSELRNNARFVQDPIKFINNIKK